MKLAAYLIPLFFLFNSCNKELVKWEFNSNPKINETGTVSVTGLLIQKNVTKSDVTQKLGLKQTAELKTLKILTAEVNLFVDPATTNADSMAFELYCDAIPLEPSHTGRVAIPKGTVSGQLQKQTVKLLGTTLNAIDLVNGALQGLITTGNTVKFKLIGRMIPSGSVVNANATIYIEFDATYWECIEKPEYTVFFDKNKGPCN